MGFALLLVITIHVVGLPDPPPRTTPRGPSLTRESLSPAVMGCSTIPAALALADAGRPSAPLLGKITRTPALGF